jgi:hypothetical protein
MIPREAYDPAMGGDIFPPAGRGECCVTCGEPVIYAYGQGPDPVDTLHAIRIGQHDHDAVADLPEEGAS